MSVNIKDSPITRLIIFTPIINVWSATVKVDRDEDLKDVKDKLPPKSLVSDGRKSLIDLRLLTPFNTIRSKVQRYLHGMGFAITPNAYAVPADKVDEVTDELNAFSKEFEDLVPDFIANLPAAFEEHIAKEPQWRELIERNRPDPVDVKTRMVFKIGAYRMAPPDADPNSRLSRSFGDAIDAVPSLLGDIADSATKLLQGPLGTGKRIGHAHSNALRGLVGKLESFGFLDHRVNVAAQTLDSMLAIVPASGQLSQGNLGVLRTICQILSDPAEILAQADMDAEDDDADTTTVANAPVAAPAPPSTQHSSADGGSVDF